ncbi:hypothetical protein GSF12_08145 [Moraxella osloensis]|uniref:Uncharacterized protein n=1 Tax=Faucicola osloensis TaxID=34062 RepID=A0A6P1KG50_FAUOS|nr:hypothetical protein [Moraxella osloensis]QHG09850.1 hypothetical protein GSF12_08145 [Moraxella osloensis]
MSDPSMQFFIKCQNIETGKVVTYRFAHQADLLAFSQQLGRKKLAIVDTHIAFYDIDLVFNPFEDESVPISAAELNIAVDGRLL